MFQVLQRILAQCVDTRTIFFSLLISISTREQALKAFEKIHSFDSLTSFTTYIHKFHITVLEHRTCSRMSAEYKMIQNVLLLELSEDQVIIECPLLRENGQSTNVCIRLPLEQSMANWKNIYSTAVVHK